MRSPWLAVAVFLLCAGAGLAATLARARAACSHNALYQIVSVTVDGSPVQPPAADVVDPYHTETVGFTALYGWSPSLHRRGAVELEPAP